jgi:hypothetical protein
MSDSEPSRLDARIDERIFHHFELIGILARTESGRITTHRNFIALNKMVEEEIERNKEAAEDRRERKNKRYETFIGFLAGIAQYGAAGAIGYLIGNAITFFKGHH